jgi:hypothetical protein
MFAIRKISLKFQLSIVGVVYEEEPRTITT